MTFEKFKFIINIIFMIFHGILNSEVSRNSPYFKISLVIMKQLEFEALKLFPRISIKMTFCVMKLLNRVSIKICNYWDHNLLLYANICNCVIKWKIRKRALNRKRNEWRRTASHHMTMHNRIVRSGIPVRNFRISTIYVLQKYSWKLFQCSTEEQMRWTIMFMVCTRNLDSPTFSCI